jgi:hypothetical protein
MPVVVENDAGLFLVALGHHDALFQNNAERICADRRTPIQSTNTRRWAPGRRLVEVSPSKLQDHMRRQHEVREGSSLAFHNNETIPSPGG